MTEIPEHLRKRAEDARAKAAEAKAEGAEQDGSAPQLEPFRPAQGSIESVGSAALDSLEDTTSDAEKDVTEIIRYAIAKAVDYSDERIEALRELLDSGNTTAGDFVRVIQETMEPVEFSPRTDDEEEAADVVDPVVEAVEAASPFDSEGDDQDPGDNWVSLPPSPWPSSPRQVPEDKSWRDEESFDPKNFAEFVVGVRDGRVDYGTFQGSYEVEDLRPLIEALPWDSSDRSDPMVIESIEFASNKVRSDRHKRANVWLGLAPNSSLEDWDVATNRIIAEVGEEIYLARQTAVKLGLDYSEITPEDIARGLGSEFERLKELVEAKLEELRRPAPPALPPRPIQNSSSLPPLPQPPIVTGPMPAHAQTPVAPALPSSLPPLLSSPPTPIFNIPAGPAQRQNRRLIIGPPAGSVQTVSLEECREALRRAGVNPGDRMYKRALSRKGRSAIGRLGNFAGALTRTPNSAGLAMGGALGALYAAGAELADATHSGAARMAVIGSGLGYGLGNAGKRLHRRMNGQQPEPLRVRMERKSASLKSQKNETARIASQNRTASRPAAPAKPNPVKEYKGDNITRLADIYKLPALNDEQVERVLEWIASAPENVHSKDVVDRIKSIQNNS